MWFQQEHSQFTLTVFLQIVVFEGYDLLKVLKLFRAHADALVLNGYFDDILHVLVFLEDRVDFLALLRILDGVLDQVHQNLLNAGIVVEYLSLDDGAFNFKREFEPLFHDLELEQVLDFLGQILQLEVGEF